MAASAAPRAANPELGVDDRVRMQGVVDAASSASMPSPVRAETALRDAS